MWWIVVVGAACAGFVQGLSGFAFGLVAMSLWAWSLETQLAAVLTVFGALVGQVQAAVTLRRGRASLQLLWPFLIGGLLGLPLGVYLLPQVDMHWFKFGFGAFLVVWCSIMLTIAYIPPVRWGGTLFDAIAGGFGGVLGGLGGFTGPVPTLWCTLRGWPKDQQRAVIQNFNLVMLAVVMTSYLSTGIVTMAMVPMMVLVIPSVLIPVWLGGRLYFKMNEIQFRRLVLGLLLLSGGTMIASALRS